MKLILTGSARAGTTGPESRTRQALEPAGEGRRRARADAGAFRFTTEVSLFLRHLAHTRCIQADQEEQHDACMQLMEEQEKLELAYEAALSELNEHKRRCGEAVPDEQLAGDEESDLDADASWQDIDPAETVPAVQAWPTKRGSGRRRLVSKRRIGPPQLISSTSLQTNSDVRLVKNDVEQLKQTLALLVQERRNSLASESLVGKQST
ncbi:hypothetical protein AAT19DRAFT_16546 [Rhodotorula toruloides]|uniref:Uncharacterized protein n=1 Tax=Rhodotorula toruloides TaxID=5286 RepID=A0A2T0A3N8_RHOTO|nr:hypothetical protein AAT19DRAFT_16546 [Rhodotorula toruloides]